MEPGEITHQELIGLDAEVVDSTNPSMVGIRGRVVDETRNTLVLETDGERRISKSHCTFVFKLAGGQRVKVCGYMLLGRPEDRIPKRRKRRG